MIKIAIDGGLLDMPQQEVSSTFSSLRFAEAIPEQFTTDITLPKTSHNIALLDAYGELDRGQLFGTKIPCYIAGDTFNTDGCLTVDKIEEETITATVYFGTLPLELLESKIRDLITDDSTTYYGLTGFSYDTVLKNCALYRFYASKYSAGINDYEQPMHPYETLGFPIPPSISVNALLSRLSAATGIQLPMLANDMFATAKMFKQARNVPSVWSFKNGAVQTDTTQLGLTFTETTSDISGARCYRIQVDQDCTLTIRLAGIGYYNVFDAVIKVNGQTYNVHEWYGVWADFSTTENMTAGGELKVYVGNGYVNDVALQITPSGMFNTPDDNSQQLNIDYFGHTLESYIASGCPLNVPTYMGTIENLGDYTVKELLTALCWQTGQRIVNIGGALSFTTANTAKMVQQATIVSYEPVFDGLGRKNYVTRKDGNYGTFNIDNSLLDLECSIQDMEVWSMSIRRGKLLAPIYEWEVDGESSPPVWKPSFADVDGIVLSTLDTTYWLLMALPAPSTMDIDRLGKIALVTMQTYESVSDYDFIYYQGRVYMVVDGTTDEATGLTEVRALLVGNPAIVRLRDFSDDFSIDFS